jgi:hypothetical protein
MSFLRIFGKGKLSDKEKSLEMIVEITEQLEQVLRSLGNMKESVGPSVQ